MFDADQEDILASGAVNLGVLFRLDTDPVFRIWSGAGNLTIPSDAIEQSDATYLGAGQLAGIPQLSQLINGVAERVNFTLSGVDARTMQLADADAVEVQGAQVNLGLQVFDSTWQPVGSVAWIGAYVADVLVTAAQATEGARMFRSVSLSVASAFTGRRNAPINYYTDFDQKRVSATDRFCDRVALYSQGVQKVWPRFNQT